MISPRDFYNKNIPPPIPPRNTAKPTSKEKEATTSSKIDDDSSNPTNDSLTKVTMTEPGKRSSFGSTLYDVSNLSRDADSFKTPTQDQPTEERNTFMDERKKNTPGPIRYPSSVRPIVLLKSYMNRIFRNLVDTDFNNTKLYAVADDTYRTNFSLNVENEFADKLCVLIAIYLETIERIRRIFFVFFSTKRSVKVWTTYTDLRYTRKMLNQAQLVILCK